MIWDGSEIIAAFSDPQELAAWVEARAMAVAGEAEKYKDDTAVDFPAVIRPARKGLFRSSP